MTLTADVSLTWRTSKDALRKMFKTSHFRGPFDKKHGKPKPKHYAKLNDNTFTIFIDPCEDNSGRKTLSGWYRKSEDDFLTHWLPIISNLVLLGTIHRNIFRWNYVRNKKYFLNFFCIF